MVGLLLFLLAGFLLHLNYLSGQAPNFTIDNNLSLSSCCRSNRQQQLTKKSSINFDENLRLPPWEIPSSRELFTYRVMNLVVIYVHVNISSFLYRTESIDIKRSDTVDSNLTSDLVQFNSSTVNNSLVHLLDYLVKYI